MIDLNNLDKTTPPYLVGVEEGKRHYLRITAGPVSNVGRVRFSKHIKEAEEWAKGLYGAGLTDLLDNEDPEIVAMAETCMMRAAMLAALRHVEEGVQEGDGEIVWKPSQLPSDWLTVEGFVERLPAGLCMTWYQAAVLTNANLFTLDKGDEAKKGGSASD